MHRLLIALSFTAACTATVRSTGTTGPTEPPPPPPPAYTPAPAPAPPPPGPVVTAPPPAPMPPGAHAGYPAAQAALRHARALLERPASGAADVKWDEKVAITQVDEAFNDLRRAGLYDGRPMGEHPVIEARVHYRDRLREALRLLGDAARDLEEHDNPAWSEKERKVGIEHVRRAEKFVQEAINDRADSSAPVPATPPGPPAPAAHPAYMAAIGNLRQARALLERPAGAGDVKWDEHVAIKDIDDAFAEIRKARVDDGKPMTEHPPIEAGLVYRDRLKEAEKQLHEAAQDLDQREDNAWAKKDRRGAIEAIRRAEKATHEAMADRKDDKAEKKEEKREEKAEKKAAKGH